MAGTPPPQDSLDSTTRSLHFHGETSEEGQQLNLFQCHSETVVSTILQTDKQQTE
jgi:hypothetical protein